MQTGKQLISRNLNYYNLNSIDYKKAWDYQKELFQKRLDGVIPDTLLLLEHPHTYTFGKTADRKNLISSESYLRKNKISVYDIDRGGDVTYHGPGQIVGYAILSLSEWKEDTDKYLRALEDVIIQTCSSFGLSCGRKPKYTGVWIDDRKICAIGIKVSRWITMHGFALNVNTDLSLFNGIIPCGIAGKEVTSLKKEIGKEMDISEVKKTITEQFKNIFGYDKIINMQIDNKVLSVNI
ncbi:octanoyltransferase [bacterium BMS3Abin04]|nr:octanoyltransferase [bacterium BMS3Abin04]